MLLGFPCLRRPVGVDLAPIGVGMVQIHAASERLRSHYFSAPSRLGRAAIGALKIGKERMVGVKSSVSPVQPDNMFDLLLWFDGGLRDRMAVYPQ